MFFSLFRRRKYIDTDGNGMRKIISDVDRFLRDAYKDPVDHCLAQSNQTER